jgi:prepilin-type N-terminal cleavage/methylation domain-containing protein/prepilin-type processing-associated H-X9-DG protein
MKRRRAHGFTLIEMLVVIAMVVLLAVLLFPCGCPSRPVARAASCLSNLKQIGLALSMYTQDYDGVLPWNPAPGGLPASSWAPAFRPSDCAAQPTTSFVVMLEPYVRHPEVFRCPGYPGYDATRHLSYAKSLGPAHANQIGYGFNELLIGSPCRPRTLASLRHDAKEIALIADAEQPWASTTDHWMKVNGEWARYWAWEPAKPPRHQHGQNFAFADGHARFLQPEREAGSGNADARGYYPGARLE